MTPRRLFPFVAFGPGVSLAIAPPPSRPASGPEAGGGQPSQPPAGESNRLPGMPPEPLTPHRRRFQMDSRYIAPLLITCILLAGQVGFGILESYPKTLLAIAASILTEIVLSKVFTGKWPHLASAYVSGISVGILLRSPLWWPYALCAMISITSKYVIRVNGRHLWNPSNLGIVAMLVLAHDSVATLSVQWGNTLWPMLIVWTLGSIIVVRLKRFHICATYVASFIAYAGLRSVITGHPFLAEVAPITGPMYQLFIFFMITDPKTTTQTRSGQMIVAFLIASLENVLRLLPAVHENLGITSAASVDLVQKLAIHAPYYALFFMGPSANLLEIYGNRRRNRPPLLTS